MSESKHRESEVVSDRRLKKHKSEAGDDSHDWKTVVSTAVEDGSGLPSVLSDIVADYFPDWAGEDSCVYVFGLAEGTSRFWLPWRSRFIERSFRNGKEHGVTRSWFSDGSFHRIGHYYMGASHGEMRSRGETGLPVWSVTVWDKDQFEPVDRWTEPERDDDHLKYPPLDPKYLE
jgi:hypothetical protein